MSRGIRHLPIAAAGLTFVGMGAANGARVAMVLLLLKQGMGPTMVGALLGTYSAMSVFFAIPMGRAVDRWGIRVPLLLSLAAICSGAAILAAAPGVELAYVTAVLVGGGSIGVTICLTNAVGWIQDSDVRTRAFAVYTMGVSGSNALGPMVAGVAIEAFGFPKAFSLICVIGLCSLLLLRVFWKAFPAVHEIPRRTHSKHLFELLSDRKLVPLYVASILNTMMWDSYQFIAPIWATHVGLSASTIGLVLGTFSTATLIIRVVMPLLSPHFSEWSLIAATTFLGGCGFALLPFASGAWSMAFVSCILGAGFGFGYPMILAVSFSLSPTGHEAEVTGVRSALSSTVRLVAPLVFGALASLFTVGSISCGIAALMFTGSMHARRQTSQ